MTLTKTKKLLGTLVNNLFTLFLYVIVSILFISMFLFLNLKNIKIFSSLIIFTLVILILISITKTVIAIKNKKRPKVYFLILNLVCILFFGVMQDAVKDYYIDKDTNLKFLHVFLDEDAMAYKESLDKYEYKNVIIYHDGIDAKNLKYIESCIDKAIDRSPEIYTDLSHEKLNFILHPHLEKYLLSNEGNYADGYFNTFDKTLNMPFFEDSIVDEIFESVFIHEYNHYLIDRLRVTNKVDTNALPGWFDEGVSEFFAYGDDFSNIMLEFFDYGKLDEYDDWNQTLKEGYNPYAQSHYTICYLVQKTSVKSLENIIINSGKLGFEKSFENEVGMSLQSFLDECKDLFIDQFYIQEGNIIS